MTDEIFNALTSINIPQLAATVFIMWLFYNRIDKRFDKVDQRFEKVDQQFEKVYQRFEKVDQRFEKIEEKLTDLDRRMCRMEGAFSSKECCMLKDGKPNDQVQ